MQQRGASAAEALSEDDAAAQSLGFVSATSKVTAKTNPTYKPGQKCANCIQFSGKEGAAEGTCVIFRGKLVKAKGWCKVWVQATDAKVGWASRKEDGGRVDHLKHDCRAIRVLDQRGYGRSAKVQYACCK